jgi:hypothetical protein
VLLHRSAFSKPETLKSPVFLLSELQAGEKAALIVWRQAQRDTAFERLKTGLSL